MVSLQEEKRAHRDTDAEGKARDDGGGDGARDASAS